VYQLICLDLTKNEDGELILKKFNIPAREFAENGTYATPYPRPIKKQTQEEKRIKQKAIARNYYLKNRERILAKVKEDNKKRKLESVGG
jgi:hypothetical protein